ncbi:polyphosphate kinase 1 [Haliangium sp.]|uniref:polyphosphate kinase 1 n=1 Tax=Haliangium sp. TaxID=2663208 RepID=UPI003D130B8B
MPPACTPVAPDVTAAPDIDRDLVNPELYLNRELTWLNFNWRVLHEGEDPRTPVLERVKFLAISDGNLDEFFMKRIGGLKQQEGARMPELTVDGRTPRQQIAECYQVVRALEERMNRLLVRLYEALREHDIGIARYERLDKEARAFLRRYYVENIFPLVTPQAMDPAHPFPFVSNLSLNLLVTLHYPGDQVPRMARVKVPVGAGIPRFLRVGERHLYVALEEVMAENLDLLFPGMEIDSCELFRVTRNAITELDEEEADDLLEMIETELRERKFAPIVRLEVVKGMSALHRGMLAAELGLDEFTDVFEIEGMLGKSDLWEIAKLDFPELKDPPHHPVNPPHLANERSIFHVLRDAGSILVAHPYESFATSVERFLREASRDPKVRAIKMTLYRTSSDSRVIKHLIDAARNGKQVAVVLELKARFDEEANIRWANRLEQVGIHVTYGVVGLKTHCKVILVIRQDYNGLRRYAHIGTGNYHAGTARLYSDFGLLACDDDIGHDLTELFNYLTTGYKPRRHYVKLLPAPKLLKQALLDKIHREVGLHSDESPGHIQMKMNALEDVDITRALYRAAQAGVEIDLLVRDTCRLRPGIPGLSETVTVISVVGRFLEHARIFYFRNGGDEEFYIGSADCMKRNLESRVEVVAPVENPALRGELRQFLDLQLGDQRSAWVMQSDGSYEQRRPAKGGRKSKSCQQLFVERTEKRYKEATRLKRRQPRGAAKRRPR